MEIVSLILARGGSKSIPRKNLYPFRNKPLLVHSIEYSLRCPLINRTIVSTEDLEIAEVSRKAGAEVPFMRPLFLAGDEVADYPVYRHVLEQLNRRQGYKPDLIVALRPTSPARPEGLVERSVEMLAREPLADSVRSVCRCSECPYHVWTGKGRFIKPLLGEWTMYIPRQYMPTFYEQTGDIEVMRYETIMIKNSVCGSKVLPLYLEREQMHDINSLQDIQQCPNVS